MTIFFVTAFALSAIWLVMAVVWFRRSTSYLVIGLVLLGIYTVTGLATGMVSMERLGLGAKPWTSTLLYSLLGLVGLLIYSPLADMLASRWFTELPRLEAFLGLQQSPGKLVLGILAAWFLGGFLEELVVRGLVFSALETILRGWMAPWLAMAFAVLVSGLGAGVMHLYQGSRAMAIITQLSILFGILFVVSGHNLWAVMLCHAGYDTIAFIRFARKRSKYSV